MPECFFCIFKKNKIDPTCGVARANDLVYNKSSYFMCNYLDFN